MSSIIEDAAGWGAALAGADVAGLADPARVDLLTVLERLKSAVCALQARVTDAFAVSQRAELAESGVTSREAGRSVCGQVGLARRDSPVRGNRYVGLARMLVHEMPGVLAALQRGDTSEWRVSIVARETVHLSVQQRGLVDAAIAEHLVGWGDARTEREVRAWVQRLDPYGAMERAAKAAVGRRVTIRAAADCMTYLTALLPVKEGVAVFGALHRAAVAGAVRVDEHRGKGQIMADTLVRRVLTPNPGLPVVPGVQVQVVMTDRALGDADTEPAQLVGYGPIPAPLARDLVRADEQTRVWVRRLYTDPTSGDLVTTDAARRGFPYVARAFLTARDQVCRTPWCGAPVRHADHAVAVARGGVTDTVNGNGRCEQCNLTKDLEGWATRVLDGMITTTTPTGHEYTSRAPKPSESARWPTRAVRRPIRTTPARPGSSRRPGSTAWIPAAEIDLQWPGSGTSG